MAYEDYYLNPFQPLGSYGPPDSSYAQSYASSGGQPIPVTGPTGYGLPYPIPISTGAGFDPSNGYASSSPLGGMNGPYLGPTNGNWSIGPAGTSPMVNAPMMHPMYDTTYGAPNSGGYASSTPMQGLSGPYLGSSGPNWNIVGSGSTDLFAGYQPTYGTAAPNNPVDIPGYPQPSSGQYIPQSSGSPGGLGGGPLMGSANYTTNNQGQIQTVLPAASTQANIGQTGAAVPNGFRTNPLTGGVEQWNGTAYVPINMANTQVDTTPTVAPPQAARPDQMGGDGQIYAWDGTKYVLKSTLQQQQPLQGGITNDPETLSITNTNIQQPGETLLPQLLGMLMGGGKGGTGPGLNWNMPESPGYPDAPPLADLKGPSFERSGSAGGGGPLWNITPGEVPRFAGPGMGGTAPGTQAAPAPAVAQAPGQPAGRPQSVFIPGVGNVPMPQGALNATSPNPIAAFPRGAVTAEAPQQGGAPWQMWNPMQGMQFPGMPPVAPQLAPPGAPYGAPKPAPPLQGPGARPTDPFASMKAASAKSLAEAGPMGVPEKAFFEPPRVGEEGSVVDTQDYAPPGALKPKSDWEDEDPLPSPPKPSDLSAETEAPSKADILEQKALEQSTKADMIGEIKSAYAANNNLSAGEKLAAQNRDAAIAKIKEMDANPPPSLKGARDMYDTLNMYVSQTNDELVGRELAKQQYGDPGKMLQQAARAQTNDEWFGEIGTDPRTGKESAGWIRDGQGRIVGRDAAKARNYEILSATKGGEAHWKRFENPQAWAQMHKETLARYNEAFKANLELQERNNPLSDANMEMLRKRGAALQSQLTNARSYLDNEERLFHDSKKEALDMAQKNYENEVNRVKDTTESANKNATHMTSLATYQNNAMKNAMDYALKAKQARDEQLQRGFDNQLKVTEEGRSRARFGFEKEQAAIKHKETETSQALRAQEVKQGAQRIDQKTVDQALSKQNYQLASNKFAEQKAMNRLGYGLRADQLAEQKKQQAFQRNRMTEADKRAERAQSFNEGMAIWRTVSNEIGGMANFGFRATDRAMSHSEKIADFASRNRDAIIRAARQYGVTPDTLIDLWKSMPEQLFR